MNLRGPWKNLESRNEETPFCLWEKRAEDHRTTIWKINEFIEKMFCDVFRRKKNFAC